MTEQQAEPERGSPEQSASDARSVKGETRIEEPTRAERTLARRVAESRATVPDIELRTAVEMTACAQLRGELGAGASITVLLVKACALALREVPRANAAYRDGHFELYSRVNCGLAVATEDGYAIPTFFDADRKSVAELREELRAIVGRARAGQLTPPESAGATFTLCNAGAAGPSSSTIAITPPHAVAISAGAIRASAVVQGGVVVPGMMMDVTLICDARIVYGAHAADLLARIKQLLEEPSSL